MRFLILITGLLLTINASRAAIHGGSPFCPQGSAFADGCAGAQAANIQKPTFFTGYANQSGQSYITRPPWNVAGVDYPVGIGPTYIGHFKDSRTATLPTGCTRSSGNITCNSVAGVTFDGWDFSGEHGGTGCSTIVIGSGVTGTVTITNSWFSITSSCGNPFTIFTQNAGSASNVDFEHNVVDGHADVSSGGNTNDIIGGRTSGSFTIKYNAFFNCPARCAETSAGTSIVQSYNYVEGIWGTNSHAEFDINSSLPSASSSVTINSGTPGTVTFTNSFIAGQPVVFTGGSGYGSGITASTKYFVIAAGLSGSSFELATAPGGSAIAIASAPTGVTINYTTLPGANLTVSYNTMLNGSTPPTTPTASSTSIGSPVLTFNAFTWPNINVGTQIADLTNPAAIPAGTKVLSFVGNPTYTITLDHNVASPGVGSGDAIQIGPGVTAMNSLSEIVQASFNTVNVTNNTLVTNTQTSAAGDTFLTASAVQEIAYSYYGTVNWIQNYQDATGSLFFRFIENLSAAVIGTSTFSGNISMITGATAPTAYNQTGP